MNRYPYLTFSNNKLVLPIDLWRYIWHIGVLQIVWYNGFGANWLLLQFYSNEHTLILYFQGAFWGLMAGLVTGVTRLVLVFIWPGPGSCGEPDTRPAIIKDFQYMYFAMLLFWITVIVCVIVSLLTAPPPEHMVRYWQEQYSCSVFLQNTLVIQLWHITYKM